MPWIEGISPTDADDLVIAQGLFSNLLIGFGDSISDEDMFGFNCDFTAFIPQSEDRGLLWVNHEYTHHLFVSGRTKGSPFTKDKIDMGLYALGGSILQLQRIDGKWTVERSSKNKRITGHTEIPFNWPEPIDGSHTAIGTFQNCSGSVTPWGTILTCEENYQDVFGEIDRATGKLDPAWSHYGWRDVYPRSPLHYGWVVEVDPQTGAAQKHVALGRFCHECAQVIELEDKRLVVYSGDDKNDEHFYKFISSVPGSLSEGTLYVANIERGEWISLSYDEQAILQENFKDQTEVLVFCREAAKMVGASPLDRPEDIEIDPVTGHVLLACTNNKPKGNYDGQIMKFIEANGQYDALTFESEVLHAGGEETGFSCPDNLAFDRSGNLWFTSDISGSKMNKTNYIPYKNNGLFMVPRSGKQEGKVIQILSGPTDSELTGPFFSPDGKTLFLSVQHPGERTKSLDKLTSHWPGGGDSIPRPCVVAIEGPLLEQINGLG
jgi:secreted PhoX family phosphatase